MNSVVAYNSKKKAAATARKRSLAATNAKRLAASRPAAPNPLLEVAILGPRVRTPAGWFTYESPNEGGVAYLLPGYRKRGEKYSEA